MMTAPFTRRALLAASAGAMALGPLSASLAQTPHPQNDLFLLTNPTADSLTFANGDSTDMIGIAPSPWEAAIGPDGRAYISSAQSLTIVDTKSLTILEEVPYWTIIEAIGYGEYRSGGMGIAVTRDGKTVAVGIHMNGSNGLVELFDVETSAFVSIIPVGVRPFDVVASPDSRHVYSIDHDSFTITAIELATLTATTIEAAPLGYGEFDKPHYAAVRSEGTLVLPYVGRLLWLLDPVTGESTSLPMTADTHQHGITLSNDETTAYIVGTGPAGPAQGPPSLTILDLETGDEQIIELEFPHEQVALAEDGNSAILTGGYTFANGGWDGVTRIDLESGEVVSTPLDGNPLAIARID